MIISAITILVLLALLVGYIIGLFHKRTDGVMKIIFFYLRHLRPNPSNFRKLPKTAKKAPLIIRHRGKLLWRKMSERYHVHKQANKPN